MLQIRIAEPPSPAPTSPLVLSDRLLTLAENADKAGFQQTAEHLIELAYRVFDEPRRPI